MRSRRRHSGRSAALAVALISALAVALAVCFAAPAPASSDTSGSAAIQRLAARQVRLNVRHAQVGSARIAWAEIGSGSALLLLNGTGSPMSEWDPAFLAALAESHRVIVFDYPGLAQSGPAPGRMTIENLTTWTAGLIEELGLTSTHVLGWSMGGFIAQRLAVRYPQLVNRLVLAGTNPGGKHTRFGPRWAQEIDSDPLAGERAFLATNFPRDRAGRRAGRRFLHRIEQAIDSGRYPSNDIDHRVFAAMIRAENPWYRSSRNWHELPLITHPTLVVDGRADVVAPPVNSRRIARQIPGARLHLYARAGHAFLFQDPRPVGQDVSHFLSN